MPTKRLVAGVSARGTVGERLFEITRLLNRGLRSDELTLVRCAFEEGVTDPKEIATWLMSLAEFDAEQRAEMTKAGALGPGLHHGAVFGGATTRRST